MISFSGTSKELYLQLFPENMGVSDDGGIFVGAISGYYGYTSMDLWEWIRAKQAKQGSQHAG